MIKTFKGRVSLIYLCLVAVIAVIGVNASWNLFHLAQSIDGLMTANYRSIKVVNQMIESLQRQNHAILVYLRVDGEKGITGFRDLEGAFQKNFNVERHNITEPGEKELVGKVANQYAQYLRSFSALQEIKNKGWISKASRYYFSRLIPAAAKVRATLKELARLNERAMLRGKERATVSAWKSMRLILLISGIAVGGGFLLSRFFMNRFLKPVDMLKETVKLVKAGDLNQQARVYYHDEIGELAAEFNHMTQRLLEYQQSTVGRLMAEKNQSLAIVKSIAEPLVVLNADFHLLLMNNAAEAVFEIQEAKAVNRHLLEIIHHSELFEYIAATVHSEAAEHTEKIILIPFREENYYFNVHVKLVRDNQAAAKSIVVLFQNITHLKQLEKIKTDFIATISHEFKTPLTSIMMGLSLLRDEKFGGLNPKHLETVKMIEEESQALSALVNDLLEISRIESGQSVFKIRPCSIAGIIETTVKSFLDAAARQDVILTYEAAEDLPKVNADPEKIAWVLNNLINNAIKYTNAGDQIIVAAEVKYDKMQIVVKDTGVGIPAEYQDSLFNKFVQVKGYDLEVRGTGLGLAIVKEIVEAHGGEIWFSSEMDLGTTFNFTLPLYEKEV